MKANLSMKVILLIITLILGMLIIGYYWSVNSLMEIKYLPLPVIFMSFGYVLAQILKRYLFKTNNWWDWLYYLGLLGVVLPLFFANTENQKLFHWLTDYGTFFLLIPAVMDTWKLINPDN